METCKQTSILMDCLDLLAGFSLLSDADKNELAQSLIDILANYPNPQKKREPTDTTPQYLGVYLHTSTARNSMRLAQLKCMPFDNAFSVAGSCLEVSLSLLTDKD